jgi:serine/threonine-protein kinase
LLYAFGFLMAGVVPALVEPRIRAVYFTEAIRWGPAVVSIAVALLVVAVTLSPRIPARTVLNVGLAFEVLGSFGIAASEYLQIAAPLQYQDVGDMYGGFGMSWVAVWMLLFTVVVPSAPRKAVLAALGSASAVPITLGLAMKYDLVPLELNAYFFFFSLVFPYMIVVVMAYVGARVMYRLGTDVSQAREMGSYHLTELLGRGGMGEVWRAKHRMLARPAAIKLIRPEALGEDGQRQEIALTRFEREAQATASMRSPHTMDLYDFGISDDGTFYYVMELLDGFDLESLVSQFGPVPAERAIHLLRQVCHSLGEAHASGLIHRDIKGANVFACRYGLEADFIKVLDFGLVKSQQEPSGTDLKLTAENVAGGTPAFMAPEQVLGNRPVDGRTDMYAVGCVAYWLLTGKLVFEGETAMKVMVDHAQTPPVPPSQRTELEIPASLESVILSCLEKDRERRPQNAEELSERLAACAVELPSWTPERARRWWDTHRPGVAAQFMRVIRREGRNHEEPLEACCLWARARWRSLGAGYRAHARTPDGANRHRRGRAVGAKR